MKTVWTYNDYRATLLKNGKFFAFVTQDRKNAISGEMADELLNVLNSSPSPTSEYLTGQVVMFNSHLFVRHENQLWCLPPETPDVVGPGDTIRFSVSCREDQFCKFEEKISI